MYFKHTIKTKYHPVARNSRQTNRRDREKSKDLKMGLTFYCCQEEAALFIINVALLHFGVPVQVL